MGVYRIEEQTNPAVAEKADPCLVSIPLTNPAGDGWIYNVHVFPKNQIKPGPDIDKFVTELENKHDTADISESVKWIVETTLPDDIATCKNYTVSDVIDTRLDYVTGSVKVYRVDTGKKRVLMTPDCYTVTEPNTANNRTLTVSLTDTGKKTAAKSLLNTKDKNAVLNIEYNTFVNKTAEGSLGKPIPNGATIHYTNNLDIFFEPQSVPEDKKPEVHTGGINLIVETQAPIDNEGKPYNLLKYPVKVTVNSNSHAEANKIIVENIKHYDLPYTGGTGSLTPLYMGAALILMASGMSILFIRNKRNTGNK